MHLQSLKLLAMSKTVLELRKCITTVPNLARYVHIRSVLSTNATAAVFQCTQSREAIHARWVRSKYNRVYVQVRYCVHYFLVLPLIDLA
jgi:hypothetical protein